MGRSEGGRRHAGQRDRENWAGIQRVTRFQCCAARGVPRRRLGEKRGVEHTNNIANPMPTHALWARSRVCRVCRRRMGSTGSCRCTSLPAYRWSRSSRRCYMGRILRLSRRRTTYAPPPPLTPRARCSLAHTRPAGSPTRARRVCRAERGSAAASGCRTCVVRDRLDAARGVPRGS